MTDKQNCWEVINCGREPGGPNVDELGICPTALETRLDGVHGGKNGGRACWSLSGTMCSGQIQGTFQQKLETCLECEFFQQVQKEEFPNFVPVADLLQMITGEV